MNYGSLKYETEDVGIIPVKETSLKIIHKFWNYKETKVSTPLDKVDLRLHDLAIYSVLFGLIALQLFLFFCACFVPKIENYSSLIVWLVVVCFFSSCTELFVVNGYFCRNSFTKFHCCNNYWHNVGEGCKVN